MHFPVGAAAAGLVSGAPTARSSAVITARQTTNFISCLLGSTQATITSQKRLRGERRHSCCVTASAVHFEPGLESIPETHGLFKRI
jgi:hypothetical protein